MKDKIRQILKGNLEGREHNYDEAVTELLNLYRVMPRIHHFEKEFEYKKSEIGDMNSYDIFEIGGETIAFAVKWEFVEPMIKWLNSL